MSYLDDYRKAKKELEEREKAGQPSSFIDQYRKAKAKLAEDRSDDIAPVRKDINVVQPVQQERTWFQSGALGDGVSLKNLVKTYYGTAADFWENLGAGLIGLGEQALDGLTALGVAYAKDNELYRNELFSKSRKMLETKTSQFIAKDLYDEQAIAKKIISAPIERRTGANTDSDSIFGQRSEGLLKSTGQLGGQIALQAVGVPWWVTSASTTMGAETEGALREGADFDSAVIRGAISATAEVLTEQIGGIKFKGASLDDGLTKVIARGISKKIGRTLVKLGVDAGSEAMEEGLSWFASKFGEYITSNGEEKLSQLLTSEEAMDELVESLVGGAVMGGGFGAKNAANANKQGKDYVSGFTKNEQAVIDRVYKDLVEEEAENSKDGKVSGKRKNELFEEAIKAMDEGSISIETIEEVLGGDSYKAYRDAVDNETALQKEYDGLNAMRLGELTGVQTDRKAELRRQLDEIKSGNRQALLKEKLGKDVAELAKVSRLSESYREKERRSQAFQADVSRYNGRSQQIVQKAIDSGILNNTRRSHQLVDLIAKVGGDKDMDFDFANNEKLKASGFALDGKTVNGVLTGSGVTININSAKALNSVVGHEITHVLEGSEFYSALAETATALAKAKGEYDSRLKNIEALYSEELEGYGGEGRTAALEKELVADLVGDYLFTDAEFINRLSTGDRNTFEKIFDEIKYLCRVVTAGSKEAKQLEKVKRAFEDAYRRDAKNTADDGGVRYSVSQRNSASGYVDKSREGGYDFTKSFAEQIEDYQNGVFPEKDTFLVGKTPDVLTRIGLAKLPLTMNQTHVDYSLNGSYKGSAERVNDHMLSPEQLAEIPELIADPVAIIQDRQLWEKKAREYSVDVLVGMEINGKKTLVPINVNSRGQINGTEIDSNRIQTVHGNTDTVQRLINALNEDSAENVAVFYINKEKAAEFLRPAGNPISRAAQELDGFIHSINDPGSPVKMRISSETESQQFKRWFGDWQNRPESASKIVNADGTPKVMYHGTREENGNFHVFDESKAVKKGGLGLRALGKGNYFTAKKLDGSERYGTRVIPAYLNIKTPFKVEAGESFHSKITSELGLDPKIDTDSLQKEMKDHGYDGVIQFDQNGDISIAVVFDSNQIKSATDNIGTFDGSNPDIRYSVSSQEDMFPVRKDLDAVRGKIYGSDVELRELGPVRKDLQTEEAAQDPYDDLPFDMPDNLAEGQLTDEELEADAKQQPVETVTQRLKVKFASLRQELQTNEQGRKESWEAYDRRIEELQQRYESKPKKYTKAANAILRQIAKQKQLQTQRDAEFEKRINDIKKKIDQTRELMQMDHTREDLLEQQLRRVDEQLEVDKQILEDEFQERRAQAEKLADKGSYISSEARILYDEIKNHQKGTRFSDDIGELLDAGHSFPQIKSALLMIEKYPEHVKNRGWIVEQDARAILERNYENDVFGIDKIDDEYQSKLEALEKKAKEDRESYTVAAQRKNKQQQYEQLMEDLVGDTSTWQDKKLGLQYQVNTLRRNLRDVVRDENGNRDIAKADAIWEELQGKYNQHEAELKRESARIKQAYADMKITKEEDVYIQMLGEFRHNPESELPLETVEGYYHEHKDKIDTEKVDKIIEMARKDYDEILQRVNAVLREQGMREIPYRKGYFPHFTEEEKGGFRIFLEKGFNFKYKSDDIPTDIAGRTEDYNPNKSYQHYDKQRTSDTTAYSFMKGFDTYTHGTLDWIYHIEDIQKRRAFENYLRYIHSDEGKKARIEEAEANDMWDADQVQEEIDKILKEANNPLNNLVSDLRTSTNILAGKKNTMDRVMEQRGNRKLYSIMSGISNRINANMVAGSVSSSLTNFIPITQSWGEVSPVSSAVAMKDTILSYVYDDGVVEKSDFLTNRLRQEENLYKTGWDKVIDKVGWLMEAVDNFTSQTVWRSKYQENLSQGMSEAEAIKNADEFAEGVMAGRSRGNMPTVFDEKNPLSKILTAFQLEVNNQYGYMFKDMPVNMRNEAKGRLLAGYAKMFIGAYAYNALYSMLTGRNAAFDPVRIVQELLGDIFPDEDEEEKKVSEIVGNFAENVIDELPFVSGLTGGGRIPISSALPYGEGPLEMITGTIKDIENKDAANLTWEWLNPAFYLLTPVGGGQLRKTAQGVGMFLGDKPVSGSYTSSGNLRFPVAETPLSIAQAAIFGQWANENARTYIEEGRSPIPESQIQDFVDSGLTYEAWWKRKDELKKVDNDFEANEPITSFRQVLEQVEDVAAEANAGKEELLKEKFLRSAADELSNIKSEMKELVSMPIAQIYKERNMQTLQEKANSIAQSAMDAYSKVEFDGDYARVGEKVWKHDEDGQWRRLTGEALTKYEVTSAAGDADYATDGTVQYYRTDDGWKKLTDEQIEKQDAVTAALSITPEEYWGDKREEYNFAYEKPEKYLITKAIGGYDAYKAYSDKLNDIKADKDKEGKSISGSRKQKVIKYINGLDIPYGEKLILFKSEYPADDTYNQKIVDYLYSLDKLTDKEVETILKELDFKVGTNGKVTW